MKQYPITHNGKVYMVDAINLHRCNDPMDAIMEQMLTDWEKKEKEQQNKGEA